MARPVLVSERSRERRFPLAGDQPTRPSRFGPYRAPGGGVHHFLSIDSIPWQPPSRPS